MDDFERLENWMSEIGIEKQFLNYAVATEKLTPAAGEWDETRWYMLPQVKALVGRYSKLQDEAFYRFYLPIDNEFQTALTAQ
jgi:carboxyl-terminal processing protease